MQKRSVWMIHGFDIDEKLICEGIVGDGCGGGRLFVIENETLIAYDPQTDEKIELLKDVQDALCIKKKGCDLFIECKKELIEFNLSSMTKSVKEKK